MGILILSGGQVLAPGMAAIQIRSGGARQSSLLNGLLAWYELSEAGTGVRNDSTTNANNLTNTNGATQQTGVGGVGNATGFVAASTQYLSHADTSVLRVGATMSVAAWVYLTTLVNSTLASKLDVPLSHREWVLFFNHNDHAPNDRFTFALSTDGSTPVQVDATTFGAPSTATWYLVVGTYDGANMKLSVNAGTQNTQAATGSVFGGAAAFGVGVILNNNSASPIYLMNGRIAKTGLWNRALTPTEITTLYNSGAGLAYPFPGSP